MIKDDSMRAQLFTVLPILALITGMSPQPSFGAPLLQMDFGRVIPDSPLQSGFNAMVGGSAQATATTTFGAYTVDLAGQGFFNTTTSSQVNLLDASIRNFYRDYYYNNSTVNGVGVQLSITGVTPNTPYNLTLWSFDAASSTTVPTPTTWNPTGNTTGGNTTINNIRTPSPATLYDPDNSATIQITSATNKLDLFGTTTGGSGGTRLNGFKLDDGTTDLLFVDFGQAGSTSLTQAGFVGAAGTDAQTSFSQVEGIYTVSLAGQGFFESTAAQAGAIDASVRDLYRDYYYNNSTTNGVGVTLTIDGVTPNTDYDLTLWSYDAASSTTVGTPTVWSPLSGSGTTGTSGTVVNIRNPSPTAVYDSDNMATIRVRSSGTKLEIFGTTTAGSGGTRLNAIELNAVPEPSAIILAALSAIGVGFVLRWR
jgi:hypothetical protein